MTRQECLQELEKMKVGLSQDTSVVNMDVRIAIRKLAEIIKSILADYQI